MIKKLNITIFLIFLTFLCQLYAQSDRILLKGNCNIEGATTLSNFLSEKSKIEVRFQQHTGVDIQSSNYPIIFLCGETYLKLSEVEIENLRIGILNGNLLLIDNYKSDYTLSIFLQKLLPEYPEKNISNSNIISNNPYRINFMELKFESKQVFISERLSILALKEFSILENIITDDNKLKFGSSVIFNYLIGN
tara:strand:+ start:301 stop:879 length:579 start_codon:yes stop_codon:yes gene_type:complete